MSTAHRKQLGLEQARIAYLQQPNGLADSQLAELLDVSRQTARRYRLDLGCKIVAPGRYTYKPTETDIVLAKAILAAL